MDYSKWRFDAVVDFLKIEVMTVRRVKFFTLQNAFNRTLNLPEGKNVHIDPIDAENHASDRFIVTVHDPSSAKYIDDLIAEVSREVPIAKFGVVAGEFAIDIYGAPPDLVGHLFKHAKTLVSENHRLYRDYRGSGQAIPHRLPTLNSRVSDGWQIGVGNRDDDYYQHFYFKNHDGKDAQGNPIPIQDSAHHRPRAEIRLQGAAIAQTDWQHWRNFKFDELAGEYFRFSKPREHLRALLREPFEGLGINIARPPTSRSVHRNERLNPPGLQADSELNERVRNAFRGLARRWVGSGRKRPRRSNSGTKESTIPYLELIHQQSSNNYQYQALTDEQLVIIRDLDT